MDSWIQDLRYAVRSIAGAKKFAVLVLATLAFGIGANSAVFSVLNAVVLQPLPYEEPERLIRVYQSRGEGDNFWPRPALLALREQSRTADVAAVYTYAPDGADLTDRGRTERVQRLRVSADYFRVLRVRPLLGRLFERADERQDVRIVVVSERIWREYLGSTSDAEGRSLSLGGVVHTVAAVLPQHFDDPLVPGVDIWAPVDLEPDDDDAAWQNNYLSLIARLRPGVTLEQARAELSTLTAGLPWTSRRNVRRSARVAQLQADTVGSASSMLWILLGAVVLLLIIACVNVASLFLARAGPRESEMAIRAALGCSRWRQARQLLIESLILSLAGGVAGLALAHLIGTRLLAAAPGSVARIGDGTLDGVVLAFSFVIAVLAGIAFGVAPALQFTRTNLEGTLRESGRSSTGSRRQTRTRNVLVVSQIALALVLLTGAGLLLRSFERLRTTSLGIQPTNVFTFEVHLPAGRYEDPVRRDLFHRTFHERIGALPGVRAVGAISRLPVTGTYHSWGTYRPDARPGSASAQPEQRTIEGAYFSALRIPLLRGRTFSPEDDSNAPPRVVVSQETARQLFGDEDPLGKSVRVAGQTKEIIGVVGDTAISARGIVRPAVYHSHRQFAANRNWALTQVVALDRRLPTMADDIRRELAAIDPALVLYRPRMLADVVGGGMAQERFALLLIGAFALLALLLAAIGIYGVLSYAVTRRRRELGIRMALGAPAGAILAMVVKDGGRLAGAGVVFGVVGAYAATRLLGSLLFGVSATDPFIFSAAALTLVIVALAATWIPARAATSVDPLQAVRADG
jgi:putative ABC transport system permease protein